MIGAAVLAAALVAPNSAALHPGVSLSAWPSHVALEAGARQVVHLRAPGRSSLRVEVRVAGYALDLHGQPRIAPAADPTSWVSARPRRIAVGRAGASLVLSAPRRPLARPGDHRALVFLTAAAPAVGGVLMRIRIGLVVTVRVPGALLHRLEVRALHVKRSGRRRLIELTLANRGNVIESIDAGLIRVTLTRRGRVVARLPPLPRLLLPHTTGLVDLRYVGRVRGQVRARTEVRQPGRSLRARSFWLRL